jgi:hypothetical protein
MPPKNNDESFENFLRSFEPLSPRELPTMAHKTTGGWSLSLAIAALIVIGICSSVWISSEMPPIRSAARLDYESEPTPAITIGKVNELLRNHPAQFEAQLIEASRHILPDVEEPGGLLHVLARE